MISFAISIVIFALILGILVFVHELGHFLAAKKAGIKVEEFGFGLPPKIKGFRRGETEYTLNWLPMGGFVRLLGEDDDSKGKDPRSFANKPASVRAGVILAGVLMNLALAVVVYTAILGFNGFKADFNLIIDQKFPFGHQVNSVFIGYINPGSAAENGGLEFADKVLSIDGQNIDSREKLQKLVDEKKGQQTAFVVENINTKEKRTLQITPKKDLKDGERPLGVSLGVVATVEYNKLSEKILSGALHSINVANYSFAATGDLIQRAVKTKQVSELSQGVSGPVGILGVVNTLVTSQGGIFKVLELLPLISLSLAIFNILPIPALDGGRLFFVLIELFTRKKVNPTFEKWVHSVGLIVLIGLFLLITYSDILKIFS